MNIVSLSVRIEQIEEAVFITGDYEFIGGMHCHASHILCSMVEETVQTLSTKESEC